MITNKRITGFICTGFIVIFVVFSEVRAAISPTKVIGPEACADCHKSEYQALLTMKHHKAFDGTPDYEALQRKPETKAILQKLDMRSVKREMCTNCHFTMQQESGSSREKAIAGVSCESCHGAAADWLDAHNNYGMDAGGAKATRETELPAHREARLRQTAAAGMLRPSQSYLVAENCMQCHTVPDETLVNQGGHTAGSAFELVSWSQGEVRHNFFISNGIQNNEAPQDQDPVKHRRVLYVIGRMLDLEYSLRALAVATTEGPFFQAMSERVTNANKRIQEIGDRSPILSPILTDLYKNLQALNLGPNNQAPLILAADMVKQASLNLTSEMDGSQLAALDELIPKPATSKGNPYQP